MEWLIVGWTLIILQRQLEDSRNHLHRWKLYKGTK